MLIYTKLTILSLPASFGKNFFCKQEDSGMTSSTRRCIFFHINGPRALPTQETDHFLCTAVIDPSNEHQRSATSSQNIAKNCFQLLGATSSTPCLLILPKMPSWMPRIWNSNIHIFVCCATALSIILNTLSNSTLNTLSNSTTCSDSFQGWKLCHPGQLNSVKQ